MVTDTSINSVRDPICGMKVDEKTALKTTFKGKDYYFCSQRCRNKFIQQNNIDESRACVHCSHTPQAKWWENYIIAIGLIYIAVFIWGSKTALISPLSSALWGYLKVIFIPILLGLLLGGIIDWAVPREYVSKLLAQKKKRTIFYAVMTGFLMTACSHGILALSIQLYKKGASPPAVAAFLLASPWANLPLTILMFGFFGYKAFFIVLAAIVIALISGYIYMFLEGRNWIEHNPNTVEVDVKFSIGKDFKERLSKAKISFSSFTRSIAAIWDGSVSLANMVLWWIMLGALLASLAAAYIPAHFMHQYMGASILGLLVTLAIATVMEICSEGTAPLAFEIYRQTGALGNAFVFLMAGVVTDYTEIGLLWTNIGWRTAVWLPIVTVPQVLLLGYLANLFL
ncbi:MAG: permease [bacterium]